MRSFVVSTLLLTAALSAQDPAPARRDNAAILRQLLAWYDKDQDGKITKTEYPRGERAFVNLDRNRDGVITAADFRTPRARGERRQAAAPQPTTPKVGDVAPDFELPMLGMNGQKVKLSAFAGDRPVALIFGSYT
ncbi:MAG: hypothetical protein IPK26_09845 [Planctomycetes bacterium]|nr:hypothetical protein [Planctomycetota bacterium]